MSFADRRREGTRWIAFTALCICGYCSYAGAQQFGRLFTAPEERQRLQELREAHIAKIGAGNIPRGVDDKHTGRKTGPGFAGVSHRVEEGGPGIEGSPPAAVITLKGIVYRQDRTRIAWIHDGNPEEGTANPGYRELGKGETPDNKVAIELPVTGKIVKLKPGQSYHHHSGAVLDVTEKSP